MIACGIIMLGHNKTVYQIILVLLCGNGRPCQNESLQYWDILFQH